MATSPRALRLNLHASTWEFKDPLNHITRYRTWQHNNLDFKTHFKGFTEEFKAESWKWSRSRCIYIHRAMQETSAQIKVLLSECLKTEQKSVTNNKSKCHRERRYHYNKQKNICQEWLKSKRREILRTSMPGKRINVSDRDI